MSLLDEVRKFTAIITTEGDADGGSDDNSGSDDSGSDTGGAGSEDVASLFTEEEITAKKTAIETTKAEEARRSALTEEERAAEDTAKLEADKLNVVPEKYEQFKLDDGTDPDPEVFEEWSAFAKEKGLTQKDMQEITSMGFSMMAKTREKQFEALSTKWLADAQNDPEIGADVKLGDKSVAARAFNTIATPEMKEFVNQYKIGNHPEFLRMFFRQSSLMREDGMHMPGTGAGLGAPKGASETVSSIFNHPDRQK